MKRYRIIYMDFDTRAATLSGEIDPNWEQRVQELEVENRKRARQSIVADYGAVAYEDKIQNFIDFGNIPPSVVAFHNKFFHQIRHSFVVGGYYPALTATCALGERILNHLIIGLRNAFRNTPEYRRVYRADSFDNWGIAIGVLEAWGVWEPDVARKYRDLATIRNRAIHFDPVTDTNDRQLALDAVSLLREIIVMQFGAIGMMRWFIENTPGEAYIKKSHETESFVQLVYIPSCHLVGPFHRLQFNGRWFDVYDEDDYEECEITDEEFVRLRQQSR